MAACRVLGEEAIAFLFPAGRLVSLEAAAGRLGIGARTLAKAIPRLPRRLRRRVVLVAVSERLEPMVPERWFDRLARYEPDRIPAELLELLDVARACRELAAIARASSVPSGSRRAP